MQRQITILGRNYNVRADQGDDIEAAAAEVDRRMRQLLQRAPGVDNYTAAMLTALNLASETGALRGRLRRQIGELEHEVEAIEAVLEAALDGEKA